MNEKEVYRAAKLRELINKERRGDGVPTLSKRASEAHRIHILRRRESAASLPEEIVMYNFTFSPFLSEA